MAGAHDGEKKNCLFARRLRGRSGSLVSRMATYFIITREAPVEHPFYPPTTTNTHTQTLRLPSSFVKVVNHFSWKTHSTTNKIMTGSQESAPAMIATLTPDTFVFPAVSPTRWINLPAHFSVSSPHIFFPCLPFPACLAVETVLVTEDVLTSADRYQLPN